MKKLIIFAILFFLPAMFCFAVNSDKPQKSVSSTIRVIIPPFAIIHLGNNLTKAVPLYAAKQFANIKSNAEQEAPAVESNTQILTRCKSKTERTATETQITTTYTSTQL